MYRVLLIDDEPMVLQTLKRLLRSGASDCEIVAVASGKEAIVQLEQTTFDVVLTDRNMPKMNGEAVLAEVARRWPTTIRAMMSGEPSPRRWRNPLVYLELEKPCRFDALLTAVKSMTAFSKVVRRPEIRAVVSSLEVLQSGSVHSSETSDSRRFVEAYEAIAGEPARNPSSSPNDIELREAIRSVVAIFDSIPTRDAEVDAIWIEAIRAATCLPALGNPVDWMTERLIALAEQLGPVARLALPCTESDSDIAAALLLQCGFTSDVIGPVFARNQPELLPYDTSDSVVHNTDPHSLPLVAAGRYAHS